jgi:PAS domain S-box-containing protein
MTRERRGQWDEELSQTGVPTAVPRLTSAPIGAAAILGPSQVADLDGVPEVIGSATRIPLNGRVKPPSAVETLESVLWLSRELTVDLDGRQMVALFLRGVHELLPGRSLCVRLIDGPGGEVAQALIGGVLLPDAEGRGGEGGSPVLLKRSALGRLHLRADVEDARGVLIVEQHRRLFRDTVGGFSVPLVAAGDLYGALYVEYPRVLVADEDEGGAVASGDEPAVIALSNQLSVALRNVRLVHETRFLRDYLAQIIEHARALILAVDRDGVVTVLNQVMARALGVRRRDVLGSSLRDPSLGDSFERLREALLEALGGGDPGPIEVELRHRGGEPVRAVFNITGVGEGAQRDAAVAIGQDQTAVRLLERQVIQAEKLATLGQLAAGVVHEINNPLTSIVAYAGYLGKKAQAQGGDPQDVERLRKIAESAERIQNFTRDLVSYARPAPEQSERLLLGDILKQAASFCEHTIEKSGAVVVRNLVDGLPPIRGIKSQLQQVFINLITNACHALEEKGGEIRLETFLADDRTIAARIVDSGAGIRREHLVSIFEPFFSTKKQGQGTGLGLSIVRNIIDGHKGRIEVESELGRGATFTVYLPAILRPATDADPQEE